MPKSNNIAIGLCPPSPDIFTISGWIAGFQPVLQRFAGKDACVSYAYPTSTKKCLDVTRHQGIPTHLKKRCYIRILFYSKRPLQYILHIFGEVRHLQFVFLRGDVVGGVGWEDGAGMLHNHLAAIAY